MWFEHYGWRQNVWTFLIISETSLKNKIIWLCNHTNCNNLNFNRYLESYHGYLELSKVLITVSLCNRYISWILNWAWISWIFSLCLNKFEIMILRFYCIYWVMFFFSFNFKINYFFICYYIASIDYIYEMPCSIKTYIWLWRLVYSLYMITTSIISIWLINNIINHILIIIGILSRAFIMSFLIFFSICRKEQRETMCRLLSKWNLVKRCWGNPQKLTVYPTRQQR